MRDARVDFLFPLLQFHGQAAVVIEDSSYSYDPHHNYFSLFIVQTEFCFHLSVNFTDFDLTSSLESLVNSSTCQDQRRELLKKKKLGSTKKVQDGMVGKGGSSTTTIIAIKHKLHQQAELLRYYSKQDSLTPVVLPFLTRSGSEFLIVFSRGTRRSVFPV